MMTRVLKVSVGLVYGALASGALAAEPAVEGGGQVEIVAAPATARWEVPVRFAEGRYVLAGKKGEAFFSKDGRTWEGVTTGLESDLRWVQFDGVRWVAASTRKQLALSDDGKTWSLSFASAAGEEVATVWRGKYWTRRTMLALKTGFEHGRYDRGKDEALVNWDGQLTDKDGPLSAWVGGDRVHVLLAGGREFISDNGEYFESAALFPTGDTTAVYYAEGNNRAITVVEARYNKTKAKPLVVAMSEGGAYAQEVETPFTEVRGLAYGAGRFIVLGATPETRGRGLLESVDGRTWRVVVSTFPATTGGLAFGPAGFVVNMAEGKIAIYRPAALPEQPMVARQPTSVPEFTFKDLSGRGDRAHELRALRGRADKGEVAARVELAFLMTGGDYVLSNPWRAEQWFKAGLAAGEKTAGRGYAELLTKWKPETARTPLLDLYRWSAERGDGAAMAWLALNLEAGPAGDRAEIERWREAALAADAGFAALWAKREVLDANREAAFAGDFGAIEQVLPILVGGELFPPDWEAGITLADVAAETGRQEAAQYLVGLYQRKYDFLTFKSVFPTDEYQRLLDRGATMGYKPLLAQRLENLLTGRFGYQRDEKQALKLAQDLADTGDADGMLLVAMVLGNSRGEQKDEAAAAEWMRKAAAAGNLRAQQWVKQQDAAKPANP